MKINQILYFEKNHPTRKYPETCLGDKMTKLSKPFLKAHVSVWANQPYKLTKQIAQVIVFHYRELQQDKYHS